MVELKLIRDAVLQGKLGEISQLVQNALDAKKLPHEIIDQGLIAGMTEVGVLFKNEEMYEKDTNSMFIGSVDCDVTRANSSVCSQTGNSTTRGRL